jgi:ATP-binding cassette subfamily C (CFTR/MRP) protein 1
MQAFAMVVKQMQVMFAGMRASNKIHGEIVKRVINAPINLFYDVTPTGRVLNKFTKDLGTLDDGIHHHLNWIYSMFIDVFQVFTIIFFTNWTILLLLPLIFIAQLYFLKRTIPAWKEMCRLSSTVRSPMINLMDETTAGASTIKAFGRI